MCSQTRPANNVVRDVCSCLLCFVLLTGVFLVQCVLEKPATQCQLKPVLLSWVNLTKTCHISLQNAWIFCLMKIDSHCHNSEIKKSHSHYYNKNNYYSNENLILFKLMGINNNYYNLKSLYTLHQKYFLCLVPSTNI